MFKAQLHLIKHRNINTQRGGHFYCVYVPVTGVLQRQLSEKNFFFWVKFNVNNVPSCSLCSFTILTFYLLFLLAAATTGAVVSV